MAKHIPVLQKEVIKFLGVRQNRNFIDATIGQGGHTAVILQNNKPRGKVLGIDADASQIKNAKNILLKNDKAGDIKERLTLINASYVEIPEIVKKQNFHPVHGILFDFGMSSWHLEESKRGFSFQRDEILDMRYSLKENSLTAWEIINNWSEKSLEEIFWEYGEEGLARKIAEEIVFRRKKKPIERTLELVNIINEVYEKNRKRQTRRKTRIQPATKVFQALRIAVNAELLNIENGLKAGLKVMGKEGRIVAISFHSLEDRIVKNFFKNEAKKGTLKILTKKPLVPTGQEIKINPRSRSAKLRAAVKN